MNLMKQHSITVLFMLNVVLFVLLSGCGYKPSAQYAKQVVGEKVSSEVIISMQDPENTVIIKDAIQQAVINRFHASLTKRSAADTHLRIVLNNVSFSPLQYDENGYIVVYRTRVSLQIRRITGETSKLYPVSGYYDFVIEPNAIISDQARFEAIQFGAQKAIDGFAARVAAEGVRKSK
jgi:hypothetical protein